MSQYQAVLSKVCFSVMEANLKMFEKLKLPVISTARPFDFYRKVFFEDLPEQEVLKMLKDKRIVDIGCGLTPFTQDSMFQKCRDEGIDFFGVDPKLAKGFKFGLFDRLKAIGTGAGSMPKPNMPGLEKAIAAFADDLPFENESVDIVLSSWLLFAWIQDEALLVRIFKEFDRILKPGGTVRFFPTVHWQYIEKQYPKLVDLLTPYRKTQRFMIGFHLASLPPTYVTFLHKKISNA